MYDKITGKKEEEVTAVRTGKYLIFYMILITAILCSGISADSMEMEILGNKTAGSNAVLESIGVSFLEDSQMATREMLGNQTNLSVRQIANRISNRWNTRLLLVWLCLFGLSGSLFSGFAAVHRVCFRELQMQTAVLCYLHDQDGKK